MANVPAQLPNIDLPGAEFFNLKPDGYIALQGRRRVQFSTPTQTVPASSSATITDFQIAGGTILETGFTDNSGIYIHKADLVMFMGDASLKLTINATGLGLRTGGNAGGAFYNLGSPLLNFATPSNTQQVAATERELLVTSRDVQLYSFATDGLLHAAFTVTVTNSDTAAHTLVIRVGYIYTRLDGIVE